MKKILILVIVFFVSVSVFAAYKNLKFFPAGINEAELTGTMKAISAGMGVKCNYCHDMKALEKDTDMKILARGMFVMVKDINTRYSATMFSSKKIGCISCHNGQAKPKTI